MLVYGRNVAEEYLKYNSKKIRKIIIQEGFDEKKINSLLENVNIPTFFKKKKY